MSPRTKPTPRASPGFDDALVRRAGLADLLCIADLVAGCAADGVFSAEFLDRRALCGLMIQLAAVCVTGRLMGAGKPWPRARLQVVSAQGVISGFALWVTRREPDGRPSTRLCMQAIVPQHRRQGLGRLLLRRWLAAAGPGACLDALCLPAAGGMQRLLVQEGFTPDRRAVGAARRWVRPADAPAARQPAWRGPHRV